MPAVSPTLARPAITIASSATEATPPFLACYGDLFGACVRTRSQVVSCTALICLMGNTEGRSNSAQSAAPAVKQLLRSESLRGHRLEAHQLTYLGDIGGERGRQPVPLGRADRSTVPQTPLQRRR